MADGVLWCSRGHRLVRFEAMGCGGGHEHRIFRCPLRVGRRVCGEVVVLPPMGGACDRERES